MTDREFPSVADFHSSDEENAVRALDLQQRLKKKQPPIIMDVRSGFEYRRGHIPGAVHAPLWKLLFRQVQLPENIGTELVLTCEHGPRAQMVQGLLRRRGYRNIVPPEGHMSGWRSAGLETEK